MKLAEYGFALFPTRVDSTTRNTLRETLFAAGEAGARCLLDVPAVRITAIALREELSAAELIPSSSIAIQAIAFDKAPDANWKVPWHQDLMFPFAAKTTATGFTIPSIKDGIHYARPPLGVLEAMTAVRLHLDDCDNTNGPLRISPGSHRDGILKGADIAGHLLKHGEATCLAKEGEAILMKVLALHASSPALSPKHRRVLHLVYYCGVPIDETWHRAV